MSEKFFKGVILFAAAVSTISFAWGLAEYNGLIGESERGARRIKRSLVIIAACGLSYAIVAFVAG
ncbi:MAG: hypothetical protein HKP58_01205 [Desulfatitalea sp.]|nr:hypothetical protein [Desulfatitalea sp.]